MRVLGFTPMEEFVGYIAACDIVLNLRFPTVGESSGTLLRSLGTGHGGDGLRISDRFAEYPDEICLKVPVDATEEDTLFEYLNVLVSRPDLRQAWVIAHGAGSSASATGSPSPNDIWVSWKQLHSGRGLAAARRTRPSQRLHREPAVAIEPEYIVSWAETEDSRSYLRKHITRDWPRRWRSRRPAMLTTASWRWARTCRSRRRSRRNSVTARCAAAITARSERRDRKVVESEDGEKFECDVDLFDAEKDRLPLSATNHFDTVLCCELIEHLPPIRCT